MSRTLKLYLEDIDNSIHKINKYIKDMNQIEFLDNDLIYDAVIRNLQIIGEATKNIPKIFPTPLGLNILILIGEALLD